MSHPDPRSKPETRGRSLLKAVSWRCVGTLDTFLVSLVVRRVSGATDTAADAVKVSSGIASVEIVTKVMLYYLHERAWARIPMARFWRFRRPEAVPVQSSL